MELKALQLLSRSEAMVKGISFVSPVKVEILGIIEKRSTMAHARNGSVLKVTDIEGLGMHATKDGIIQLIRLKVDTLITFIPFLVFLSDQNKIDTRIAIISKPVNKNQRTEDVFHKLVECSIKALEELIDSNSTFAENEFSSLLEENSIDVSCANRHPNVLINPEFWFDNFEHPFTVDDESLKYIIKYIDEIIKERNISTVLPSGDILSVKKSNQDRIRQRLQNYFESVIIPSCNSISSVTREFEVHKEKEEIYKLENPQRTSILSFILRVQEVRKYMAKKYVGEKTYPGIMAMTLLESFESTMEESNEKEYMSMVYEKYEELKSELKKTSNKRIEGILFLSEKELENLPYEVGYRLKRDPAILSAEWNVDEQTYFVIALPQMQDLKVIIKGMKELKHKEQWKMLAFRKLLQDSIEESPELNPFFDIDFREDYEGQVKLAYAKFLPFHLSFLASLGVNFLNKIIFNKAKKEIVAEQDRLFQKHKERKDYQEKLRKKAIKAKKEVLQLLIMKNRVLNELDSFYLSEGYIPTVSEVSARAPDIEQGKLLEVIEKYKFQLIDSGSSGAPIGAPIGAPLGKILFYPKGNVWKQNTSEAFEVLQEKLQTYGEDTDELERIRIRFNLLDKIFSTKSLASV